MSFKYMFEMSSKDFDFCKVANLQGIGQNTSNQKDEKRNGAS